MDIRKTELPREIRIKENKRNRQLATIIRNTNRWMQILYHESSGLLGNINWISQIMQDEIGANDFLPEETFTELNQTAQKNIYTLKEIYTYMQVMNAVADNRMEKGECVILNEAMLLSSVPVMSELEVEFNGLAIKGSRAFAKVVIFLLNKMLEVARSAGLDKQQIGIAFNTGRNHTLHVCVSGSALFWHHELWEQRISDPLAKISYDPAEWTRQMFYEMLALVDGKIVSGCTRQRKFSLSERRPRLATELIQKEISRQHLEFSIPFGLEKE